MPDVLGIGERLAVLRTRRGHTQEQLAEKAGLSVDTIRKLEQGQRQTARLATLNALARALDVETSVLVGQPTVLQSADGGEPPSILALRQAVTPVGDVLGTEDTVDEDPPPVAHLRESMRHTERIRRKGELTKITALLPVLIADARKAVHAYQGDGQAAAYAVLAEAYQVAGTTLAAFGKEDAAFTAIERSMWAARRSDDQEHLEVIGISSLSWIFTKQGRVEDAQQVALRVAERIEPTFRSAPIDLSLWGILLLRAATAAVRHERTDDASELLSLASAAAARIGTDRIDYATPFGPTNAALAAVNAYVDMGEPRLALQHARNIHSMEHLPPTWEARHYVDRALAHAELDQNGPATRALLAAERIAPEWMRYHATSRHLVAELRFRDHRRHSPIRDLAGRLSIEE